MANVSSSNGLEKYPKLRFNGFSEPWEHVMLSDFVSRVTRKNSDNQTDIPLTISSKDGLINQNEFFSKQVASKDMSGYYLLQKGEFAYNKSYSVGFDFGSIKRLEKYDQGALSTLYICFALDRFDSDFIKHYFDSLKWYREIYMISAEGARNHGLLNVPTEDFFATLHALPMDTAEQRRIAEFLDLLTSKIEKQQALVDNLKKYKRGALQHIFHKMTDCSTVTVGDVFTKANKRNSDGRVKNVITNSAEYGLIPQRDFFDKDIAVDGNTNNYFIIQKGCFVYNPRKSNTAPYGPFNCYQGEEEGIISPLYTCLVKKSDVDSTYLSWYFKSDSWYRYIYDNGSQGVRHDRVSMTDDLLMGIPIKLPNGERQKEIGAFFDAIDAKLKCETDILNALIKIKNGLYDKMFI